MCIGCKVDEARSWPLASTCWSYDFVEFYPSPRPRFRVISWPSASAPDTSSTYNLCTDGDGSVQKYCAIVSLVILFVSCSTWSALRQWFSEPFSLHIRFILQSKMFLTVGSICSFLFGLKLNLFRKKLLLSFLISYLISSRFRNSPLLDLVQEKESGIFPFQTRSGPPSSLRHWLDRILDSQWTVLALWVYFVRIWHPNWWTRYIKLTKDTLVL